MSSPDIPISALMAKTDANVSSEKNVQGDPILHTKERCLDVERDANPNAANVGVWHKSAGTARSHNEKSPTRCIACQGMTTSAGAARGAPRKCRLLSGILECRSVASVSHEVVPSQPRDKTMKLAP
jgi:hypothetical protein